MQSLLATLLCGSLVISSVTAQFFGRQNEGHKNDGHGHRERGQHGHAHGELPSVSDVKLILVGFRHGNRNPSQWLKNDTTHNQWAWEGDSQLTKYGKKQAFSLGQFLRTRYSKVIPDDYFPDQVKAYSSSAERVQQTLQTAMAGLFPPSSRAQWNPSLNWQPIPYEINDPLLRMYNVKCPYYKTSYQVISDDNCDDCRKQLDKDKDLVNYISQNSGLNVSLSDLADVADNIIDMKIMGAQLPSWVTSPTLPGYPPKNMYDSVASFAEAHQIICAADPECSRLMAGLWLDQVITTLKQKKDGKLKARVGHFYGGHTETVLSLIRLMKTKDVPECPTTGGFILEYTDVPQPAVRFIFHEPDPNNADVRLAEVKELPYCSGQDWCPLDTFISNIKAPSFSDWQAACKLPKCPTA